MIMCVLVATVAWLAIALGLGVTVGRGARIGDMELHRQARPPEPSNH